MLLRPYPFAGLWYKIKVMKRGLVLLCLLLAGTLLPAAAGKPALAQAQRTHLVQPGETWVALAWRYGLSPADLARAYPHLNRQRQPAIGATLLLPDTGVERTGLLIRSGDGGSLATAARHGTSIWTVPIENAVAHPYRPLFYRPLFVAGGDEAPRDLPPGFNNLELSQVPAHPGEALALRSVVGRPLSATVMLGQQPFDAFQNGNDLVAVSGTGAFFGAGEPELAIKAGDAPLWVQPWRFEDKEWNFDRVTLTGEAAEIDAESIRLERERLFALWEHTTPVPQWAAPFRLPIDNYLAVSSNFGARRSYNGGPFSSYHEGVDFSAYGGTPVLAPAAGTVILAELLYVRGGAVILDHGLGIYTGYYHMSSVAVTPGEIVQPGHLLGEVGTTGLSTGNHLHWDLLVNAIWVDAAAWLEQDTACWILAGLGQPCAEIGE